MIVRIIKRIAPAPLVGWLKDRRRDVRRQRWRWSVTGGDTKLLTVQDLAQDLRDLGVEPGRDLVAHSSLSSLGLVDGGAETVIAALRDVIGDDATLLMPTYPIQMTMLEEMRSGTPFDVRETPSRMGKISEVFRLLPDTLRSAHPTHSVAAQGPKAAFYTEGHHQVGTPCGPGSPLHLLANNGGQILCLGCLVGHATSTHIIEDLVDNFPVNVYLAGSLSRPVRFADGHTEEVATRVHDPALAPIRIDNHPPKEAEIAEEMRRRGILKEGAVGKAHCYLFRSADFVAMFADLAKQGRTIYATD